MRTEESIELGGLSCRRLHGCVEAALLFAAGRVADCRSCLGEMLEANPSDPRPWAMRFDLHRALGEQAQFDSLLECFRERFPAAPLPSWSGAAIPAGAGVIALTGVLARPSDLAPMLAAGAARIVAIDLGRLERLDYALAPLFCASLRALAARGKRILLANVCELHGVLLREIGLPDAIAVLPRRTAAEAEERMALAA